MTRIINISGHGGSGKSVISLNLALALAMRGSDTILVDGNIHSPDISAYAGLYPKTYLNEFIIGQGNVEEFMTYHSSGLKVIPSISEKEQTHRIHEKLNQVLVSLIGKSDIVIVDSSPYHSSINPYIHHTDETILVTNDDLPSIAKSKESIDKIQKAGSEVIGVILNKQRTINRTRHVDAILGKKVILELPYDEKIIDSINRQQPILLAHPKNNIAGKFRQLAELLDLK